MLKRKKLLIVEDEGLVALDLKTRLEEIGYLVTAIADNMEDAIAAVAQNLPDLVLMDIRLKGTHDGIETADRLRKDFDVPSIFVTAYGDTATLERAKLAEPFGYVVKPFVNVDFRAQIEIVIWKHAMEQKLRRGEAWLQAVVRNVGDAVIATDADGRVAVINEPAAQLTGCDSAETKGQPLLEVFCAFDDQTGLPVLTPLETLYKGGELRGETRRLLLKHRGQERFRLIEARISPNRDADHLLGVIVVFRDITERCRAEERTRQLEKSRAVAALGAGIAQELRGLVDKIAASKQPELNSELAGWCKRAQALAEQIAEPGQAGEPSARRIVDVNEVLERLSPKLEQTFEDREIKISLLHKLPPIEADSKELKKNLLAAASELRQLRRRRGMVRIETRASRDWRQVELTMEDLGKPPKPEIAEAPEAAPTFARIHSYMVVEGGVLRVFNTRKHGIEGTTLTFIFPAAATTQSVLAETTSAVEEELKAS